MTRSVAAIGDVSDPGAWSGIPYHFWRAAVDAGFAGEPIRLNLAKLKWPRRHWVVNRVLHWRVPYGFQYSREFLNKAESQIPPELKSGEVFSFTQHFPRASTIRAAGGRINYYIDATFASLAKGRGLQLNVAQDIVDEARALERENYRLADRVIAMARWTADSLIHECDVPADKVSVVLPGANLDVPEDWSPRCLPTGRMGKDRPFVLGFVGKDWERKGLPKLCELRDTLADRGWNVVVRVAGEAPVQFRDRPGVEFVGFIDKRHGATAFVNFLSACDFGCLFSEREALGISTLEFLRAGIPVAGYAVEGPADTLPPDAGLRFSVADTVETIADAFESILRDPDSFASLMAQARRWSGLVTWERCIRELQAVWGEGVSVPMVQPWKGLARNRESTTI